MGNANVLENIVWWGDLIDNDLKSVTGGFNCKMSRRIMSSLRRFIVSVLLVLLSRR